MELNSAQGCETDVGLTVSFYGETVEHERVHVRDGANDREVVGLDLVVEQAQVLEDRNHRSLWGRVELHEACNPSDSLREHEGFKFNVDARLALECSQGLEARECVVVHDEDYGTDEADVGRYVAVECVVGHVYLHGDDRSHSNRKRKR